MVCTGMTIRHNRLSSFLTEIKLRDFTKPLNDGNLFLPRASSYSANDKGLTLVTSAYKLFTMANLRYQLS